MASFGEYIAARRKALKLTQKDMAAQIKKGDGTHISNTYLLDVGSSRKNCPISCLRFVMCSVSTKPAIMRCSLNAQSGSAHVSHALRVISPASAHVH